MPFYLFQSRCSADALQEMITLPQDREVAIRPLIEAVGGTLHSMFFGPGLDTALIIVEAPDDNAMAACAMVIAGSDTIASGATRS